LTGKYQCCNLLLALLAGLCPHNNLPVPRHTLCPGLTPLYTDDADLAHRWHMQWAACPFPKHLSSLHCPMLAEFPHSTGGLAIWSLVAALTLRVIQSLLPRHPHSPEPCEAAVGDPRPPVPAADTEGGWPTREDMCCWNAPGLDCMASSMAANKVIDPIGWAKAMV
jgi:hypothetical protein